MRELPARATRSPFSVAASCRAGRRTSRLRLSCVRAQLTRHVTARTCATAGAPESSAERQRSWVRDRHSMPCQRRRRVRRRPAPPRGAPRDPPPQGRGPVLPVTGATDSHRAPMSNGLLALIGQSSRVSDPAPRQVSLRRLYRLPGGACAKWRRRQSERQRRQDGQGSVQERRRHGFGVGRAECDEAPVRPTSDPDARRGERSTPRMRISDRAANASIVVTSEAGDAGHAEAHEQEDEHGEMAGERRERDDVPAATQQAEASQRKRANDSPPQPTGPRRTSRSARFATRAARSPIR